MPEIHLDSRAARNDLTSRECAKLICALLGGATVGGMNLPAVRAALRRVYRVATTESILDYEPADPADDVDLAEIDSHVILMTSALIGGLAEMAARGALVDAVSWVLDNDDVWKRFETRKPS
jgi:hypothetical protein